MHLRKALTFGAAVLATGLLGLSPTAQAVSPTGGPIAIVEINGDGTAGDIPVTGTYAFNQKTGKQHFGGVTNHCGSGTASGTFKRGPRPLAAGQADLALSTFTLVCDGTPLTSGSIWWSASPGCATIDFADSDVHDDTVDTGVGTSLSRVDGVLVVPHGCMTATASGVGGVCTAKVVGTMPVSFGEGFTTVGGIRHQELVLNGTGLTYTGQNFACANWITGSVTLSKIRYDVKVTSGTTTGIDFRQSAATPPTGGAVAAVEVNGSAAAGVVPVDGSFTGGSAAYAGSTFGCSTGTVAGAVNRGPRPASAGVHDLALSTLSLTCANPLGGNATWSISPGCVINADFSDADVHDGTVDTGTGSSASRVRGRAAVDSQCLELFMLGGFCSGKVTGDVTAYFDEAVRTVGGVKYQELVLNGSGLAFVSATPGCYGLLTGGITLDNLTFDVQVTGGTTTGIDFRRT